MTLIEDQELERESQRLLTGRIRCRGDRRTSERRKGNGDLNASGQSDRRARDRRSGGDRRTAFRRAEDSMLRDRIEVEKLISVKQLAVSAAHHLNTPLSVIWSTSSLLSQQLETDGTSKAPAWLELIQEETTKIVEFVRKMQGIQRLVVLPYSKWTDMIDVEESIKPQ